MLIFTLFASSASAATDTSNGKTTQEKFDELKEKGIFKGIGGSDDAALDQEIDRGSAAAIAARLAGVYSITTATPTFRDVDSSQPWYNDVEAAARAGIIVGNGDGTFAPYNEVTNEQLAVMTTQVYAIATGANLDLSVDGSIVTDASRWASPYIQAALDKSFVQILFSSIAD